MNLLVEELPESVFIEDKEYPINTDFRNCLRIILAFEDPELTTVEKSMILLENLYQAPWPDSLSMAVQEGIKFLDGGEISNGVESGPRVYSFEKDAQFIFAAFKQTHGIDLSTEQLHWWKFMALFMDMGSDTTFSNLVSLRKRLKTGKATKEERQAAREIEDLIDLPEIDRRTLEEKEQDKKFLEAVKNARKSRNKKSD